jgi:Flp pilus assembly protein TadG
MFEFGILMSAYQSMADAAREGARYGVAPSASGGYVLPSAGSIAQQACTYLNASVGGGNPACPSYSSGSGTPPTLSSCSDSTFTSASAADNIYVGLPPTTTPESYTVNGNTLPEQLVVVGIRQKVPLHILGLSLNLRSCAAMRSENN